MKVFLYNMDINEEMIEVDLLKSEVQFISRKDIININSQSYMVNNKSIYFTKNTVIDYTVLHVEKI